MACKSTIHFSMMIDCQNIARLAHRHCGKTSVAPLTNDCCNVQKSNGIKARRCKLQNTIAPLVIAEAINLSYCRLAMPAMFDDDALWGSG